MKLKILLLIFLHATLILAKPKEKHIIGCEPYGFFSIFFGVLNQLNWCEKTNKTPVVFWGPECLYYQPNIATKAKNNAWEYYFEPLSQSKYNGEKTYIRYFPPDNTCIDCQLGVGYALYKCKYLANRLIKKYIKIKKNVADKVDDFYKKNMAGKKTIGIHLRGTDKYTEVAQIDPVLLLQEANRYTCSQYFVATDEESLLKLAKKILTGKVISYSSKRSNNGKPIHLDTHKDQALRGEEVLIEVLLLSKCDHFIHTISNVSVAPYFFNLQLPGTLFLARRKEIKSCFGFVSNTTDLAEKIAL